MTSLLCFHTRSPCVSPEKRKSTVQNESGRICRFFFKKGKELREQRDSMQISEQIAGIVPYQTKRSVCFLKEQGRISIITIDETSKQNTVRSVRHGRGNRVGRIGNRVQITDGTAAVSTDGQIKAKAGHWGDLRRRLSDRGISPDMRARRPAGNESYTV